MQEYKMSLKDEDGRIYEYNYHKFTWDDGGPLLIYEYAGIGNDGANMMALKAKFQNCRAILGIAEVEDENEG